MWLTAFALADLADGGLQLAVAREAALLVALQGRDRAVSRRVFTFTRFADTNNTNATSSTVVSMHHTASALFVCY